MKTTCLRLLVALGVAGTLLAVPTSAQAQPTADHADTLAALEALRSRGGPGAGVHAGDGDSSWSLSTGTATINTADPVGPDEHFRAGSQAKTFTAVAVLKLAEQGEIALDDPIETHLPGVVAVNGHDGTRITVRHLLQHISGIPTNNLPLAQTEPDGTYTLRSLVNDGLRFAPAGEPGTVFRYSNTNYEILGMLIEKVTGLAVHEAVTRMVIDPLGLTRTRFPAPGDRAVPEPAVHGYRGARLGGLYFWVDGTSQEPSRFYASGAVLSTLEDLTAFYRAVLDGTLLSAPSIAEFKKTYELGSGQAYGLGAMRVSLPCGGTAWGHDGAVPGYYSMTLVTEDGRHASVVTNAHLTTNPPVAQMHATVTTALCEEHS